MSDQNGESKIGGVSIRSWNATFMIIPPTLALCYLAVIQQDVSPLLVLIGTGGGFLFGKAAGKAEK